MLTLFSFLSKYDHDYVIYYDFLHWPYGDQTFEQSLAYIDQWIAYLTHQGVDAIIVPPVYELFYLQSSSVSYPILPLFTTYLMTYCFPYSLVGKIWLIGDFADLSQAQQLLEKLTSTYIPTEHQHHTKKFMFPFAYRSKQTSLWKYYLHGLSYSHILVHRILKHDLRYFKDAAVDTLIPFNYGYFHYQLPITKFLNFKKIRFHKLQEVEQSFLLCLSSFSSTSSSNSYTVTIAYTGHPTFLQQDKRLLWLLQKGKNVPITRVPLV